MELSEDQIIQKILTRFPDFEIEEDHLKVAEAFKWVCDDGYPVAYVKRDDRPHGTLSVWHDTTRYEIENVHVVVFGWTLGNLDLWLSQRRRTVVELYNRVKHLRKLCYFAEHAKSRIVTAVDDYKIATIEDAYRYIIDAFKSLQFNKIHFSVDKPYDEMNITFVEIPNVHIVSPSSDIETINRFVCIVMEYYNYFHMIYQDVKVAQ